MEAFKSGSEGCSWSCVGHVKLFHKPGKSFNKRRDLSIKFGKDKLLTLPRLSRVWEVQKICQGPRVCAGPLFDSVSRPDKIRIVWDLLSRVVKGVRAVVVSASPTRAAGCFMARKSSFWDSACIFTSRPLDQNQSRVF